MTKFKKGDKIKIKYLNGTDLQFADYAVGDILTADEDSACPWCIDKNGKRKLISEDQAELVTKDETMKKTIDNKEYVISEGEGGVLTFTPVVKERVPETGDVYKCGLRGETLILTGDGKNTILPRGDSGLWRHADIASGDYEFLGKHSDVYVKISDVVAALKIKDDDGDSIYSSIIKDNARIPFVECIEKTRDALAQLNIK